MMINFECDYCEGACEEILKRLQETNMEQMPGYGFDTYTESAISKIRKLIKCENASIRFLVGGTQTNMTVIDSMLERYEGVFSVDGGHISIHESGAIENTGHKVLVLPSHDGKMEPEDLIDFMEKFLADETHDHMVQPGMVYISHPTELGTLYSKAELKKLYETCHRYNLPLYLDGARLGYGLMSKETDVTLPDVAEYTDAFYIGGTKVGALIGEAVVFPKNNEPKRFFTSVKMHGALLAKSRVNGVQFDTLFTNDVYFKNGAHGIEMAELLKAGFKKRGIEFYMESPTNQQFLIFPNSLIEKLKEDVAFTIMDKVDESRTIVRFCTSFATKKENIEKLFALIDA